ncbi:SOS response-associated peptidase [Gulosibacter bifidus]|uniref:Abasic site processing protein n=1 Tax=Gulosibacter bifidus TaxID=272239 RepID=A0ABW5RLA0_9MICO|nr:SOS response-associated peptidase [Gulosibacter bifidus]
MCGRFVVAKASSDLAVEFDIDRVSDTEFTPSYNIAPTTSVPVIVQAPAPAEEVDTYGPGPIRRLEVAKWGLVPGWARDASVASRAFNARSETAAVKPTFRAAVKRRRAVIPASGYYEWQTGADGTKQPYYVHPAEGGADASLCFAGLYEWWQNPEGEWLLSTTILTREAPAGRMRELHHRIPVFCTAADIDEWCDPALAGSAELVADFAERSLALTDSLALRAVDRRVGNVRERGPELIAPMADPA